MGGTKSGISVSGTTAVTERIRGRGGAPLPLPRPDLASAALPVAPPIMAMRRARLMLSCRASATTVESRRRGLSSSLTRFQSNGSLSEDVHSPSGVSQSTW